MTLESIKEKIKKYLDKYPTLSNSQLATLFLKENPKIEKAQRTIRTYISELKQLTVTLEEDAPRYHVVDNNYVWKSKRGELKFTVLFIDQLFYEYSKNGLDYSQTKIINKHNLKVWEWNSIKNAFQVYKQSHIFSPYTVETTPKEELETMISSKMDKLFNQIGYQVEKKYEQSLLKKHKQQVTDLSNYEVQLQTMVTELSDLLPLAAITPTVRIVDTKVEKIISVHLFDIHFGAETRQELRGLVQYYSPEIVKKNFEEIADIVNKQQATEVHIFFGGDLIESMGANNHINSFKGIAKGYFGSKVVMECYKLMAELISKINNVKTVYGISGNHDRADSNSKLESEGFIGELIFEFLNVVFKDKIKVEYHPRLISANVDNIVHIMTHGDKKFTDLPPSELILEYGIQGKYHLLTSGHWHERKIKKDSKNFRHIVCPSLFPGNDYSFDLGYSTNPGFLISYNNGSNKPVILDYSL